MTALPQRFDLSSSEATEPARTDHVPMTRYALDPAVSRFTLRAFATGLLSAFGHNPTIAVRDFDGEIRLAPDSLEEASLHFRVSSASLAVQDQINDKDRREMERQMKEQVLETASFPKIVYECTDVSGSYPQNSSSVVLDGNLTLRDVTRKLRITAQINTFGDMLRASGEFAIQQSDYNIKPVTALGGTLRLKDELKFAFDIVARKQD